MITVSNVRSHTRGYLYLMREALLTAQLMARDRALYSYQCDYLKLLPKQGWYPLIGTNELLLVQDKHDYR